MKLLLLLAFALLLGLPALTPARAAAEPTPAPAFDPVAATDAYLAKVPADERARSDRHFEGGYWLLLWNYLLTVGISLALLGSGLSRRMRDFTERTTRFRALQIALYWAQYLLLTTLLAFPLTVYENFFREHQYGLSNQSFADWFSDQRKALLIALVLNAFALSALYAVVRRFRRTWWLWGSVTAVGLLAFAFIIGPVFIAPVFNRYTPLADPAIRDPILSLARANGIPAHDVFVFDASKQTTRISANVSGLLGTERISLNDNLLKRCSLPEIEGVMAHEMGHYVLHHSYIILAVFGGLTTLGFLFLQATFERLRVRHPGWGIRGVDDPAGLPLLVALFATFFFVVTPITNSLIRTFEAEADLFGLNAARQPDGMAEVFLKLGAYRKLAPGPLEEMVFFDHPAGRTRINMAMRWKAENLAPGTATSTAPAAVSPQAPPPSSP